MKSEGTINNFDDYIIETKCSTANGMSGSPILIKSGTGLKYIGLHIGGPPLPYQRGLKLIYEHLERFQIQEAHTLTQHILTRCNLENNVKRKLNAAFNDAVFNILLTNVINQNYQNLKIFKNNNGNNLLKSLKKCLVEDSQINVIEGAKAFIKD